MLTMLTAPAPLTAADALAMCLVSACVGACLLLVVLIVWIRIRIWLDVRRAERERQESRTVLKRI
jgi:hypothetical protein